jgi:hypothetical protein
VGQISLVAQNLRAVPRAALEDAAQQLKELAEQVGGSMHIGRRTVRFTTMHTISGPPEAATLTVKGVPTGPWVWITDGTGPHVIAVRRRRSGARPPALQLAGGAHPIPGPVMHPGSAGRGAWRQVQAGAAQLVPAIFAQHVHGAVG